MFFMHKKILKIVSSLIFFMSISGCANNTNFTSSEKAVIYTVSINPNITIPQNISYYDRAQMGSLMGAGLIGYAIVNGAESNKKNNIKNEMQQQNIIINAMLKQSFIENIKSKTNFTLIQNGFGDAQFKLEVNSYGFGTESISSDSAIPNISANAMLVNSKGKILWQNSQKVILDESPYNTYVIEYYLKNPLVMKQAFQSLVDELADNFIENLQTGN